MSKNLSDLLLDANLKEIRKELKDLMGGKELKMGECCHGNVTARCPICRDRYKNYKPFKVDLQDEVELDLDYGGNVIVPITDVTDCMADSKPPPLSINQLGKDIKEYRQSIEVETPSELNALMLAKLMRVVMELAEAGEEVRAGNMEAFQEECADVFMLLSDIVATVGFDVETVIREKLDALDKEPRGKWHGKAIGI